MQLNMKRVNMIDVVNTKNVDRRWAAGAQRGYQPRSPGHEMLNHPDLSPAGEWYRNRDEWVRHVLGRPYLSPDHIRVGIFIAMHMNRHDNHTKHQQTTIAKDLNLDPSTVKRAVRRLRDEGLIDVETAIRGRRNRAANLYFLIFPWAV